MVLASAHDWGGFLARCDKENQHIQLGELGMGAPQYIAEMLGLHEVGNSLTPGGERLTQSHLDRVTAFEAFTCEASPIWTYTLRGRVVLDDGSRLRTTIDVLQRPDGSFVIMGAVG